MRIRLSLGAQLGLFALAVFFPGHVWRPIAIVRRENSAQPWRAIAIFRHGSVLVDHGEQ